MAPAPPVMRMVLPLRSSKFMVGLSSSAQATAKTVVIAVVMFAAYGDRIQVEEQMLAAALGQPCRDYQARTRKLIPFVY